MAPKTPLPFTKMQGTGNDFIIIDNRDNTLSKEQIIGITPAICDRHFGVGGDGLIALHQAEEKDLDHTMFYRNADGSDAGMCGNGARCLARYAANLGLGRELRFNVHENIYSASVDKSAHMVTLSFPMETAVKEIFVENEHYLKIPAGTEHVVKEVSIKKLQDEPLLRRAGRKIRNLSQFNPPGTNVNFICAQDHHTIELQTYERGVEDLTLACGTGAIASGLGWHHINNGSETGEQTIEVHTKGGVLQVQFSYDGQRNTYQNIKLTGKAEFVFEGTYTL
jgi:diaminopimelate epimerase